MTKKELLDIIISYIVFAAAMMLLAGMVKSSCGGF